MDLGVPEFVVLGLLGAAVGSFINVVAYRLPRRISLLRPRSSCPSCGAQIAAYDNVPIVSWLVLGGRCRSCSEAISVRYPIVEAAAAAVFVAVGLRAGGAGELVSGLVFVTTLIIVGAIDLEHRIVPNRVLAPAAAAALVIWAHDPGRLGENLIAGAAAGGFLLVFALIYPAGMGMGDVKLAAVMGLYLGRAVAPALLASFAVGALVGVGILIVRGAAARKQGIPFAPFLALGGILGQLFGAGIVDWYLAGFS